MSKIVSLKDYKDKKLGLSEAIRSPDKLKLLDQMVAFQEERTLRGELTLDMVQRGIPLFSELFRHAETDQLKELCFSYHKHLIEELKRLTPNSA